MFNKDFSFVSGSSDPVLANPSACASKEVSPLTTRCSSPNPEHMREPRKSRDTRYDIYRSRHTSMAALTTQLENHILMEREPIHPDDYDTPSPDLEEDEGYFDSPSTPSTITSDYSSDYDASLYDLSMTDLSATSSARPSLSLEAQAFCTHTQRRRQRQSLIRLQCMARHAPDLAMLLEECHPSSMAVGETFDWNSTTSRSGCATNVSSGRIEKDRRTSAHVRKSVRQRKSR